MTLEQAFGQKKNEAIFFHCEVGYSLFVILHTSKLREIKLPWWIRCIMLLDSLAAKQFYDPSDNAGVDLLVFLNP